MAPKPPLKKRRKYDEDFKAEVLKRVENGQAVSQISRSLGVSENLIYGWKSKRKAKTKDLAKGEKIDFSLRLLEKKNSSKRKSSSWRWSGRFYGSCIHFQPGDLRMT